MPLARIVARVIVALEEETLVEPIIAFFTQWRTQMLTLGPIVAGFGVACWFIMNSLSGIMPEWAQNARGWVQRILVGAIVLGLAPALITAFIGMGGGAP